MNSFMSSPLRKLVGVPDVEDAGRIGDCWAGATAVARDEAYHNLAAHVLAVVRVVLLQLQSLN